jgi:hypothetical protein
LPKPPVFGTILEFYPTEKHLMGLFNIKEAIKQLEGKALELLFQLLLQ